MSEIGYGADFLREGTSVGELAQIVPPKLSRDAKDVTHFNSPDGYKQYIPGLKDGGEVTFAITDGHKSAAHQAVIADINSDEIVNYSIVFADGSTWAFTAFVTGIDPDLPIDDKIATGVTMKITGKPVFTPGV